MGDLSIERLRPFLQNAYSRASAVQALFDKAGLSPGDIHSLSDLEQIPVTSKDRLVQLQSENPPFGGFLATPQVNLKHIFLSPGPLYEPHTGDSPVMDSIRETLSIAGFEAGDVVLNAFGYHLIPTGIALDQMLNELGATVVPAGVGNAELQIKMMADLGVTGYVGLPSWLISLIQKVEESGGDFQKDFQLKKALVSAEPLPPDLRAAFVERYGLQVTNAYGTAELGFIACNTEGGLAMRLLESSIVQIANPESGQSVAPGEVGEVVVTSFNQTYPLIRLGTGDLAMNVDPAPGQSRQGERAIILVGRVGDAVKVRGMFVHPNQLRFAAGQVPGVGRVQAVISRAQNRDELSLNVLPAAADADREALSAALSQAVRSVCRVSVERVNFVLPGDLKEDVPLIVDDRR
jgi:phenylacetate-CoA ligase